MMADPTTPHRSSDPSTVTARAVVADAVARIPATSDPGHDTAVAHLDQVLASLPDLAPGAGF